MGRKKPHSQQKPRSNLTADHIKLLQLADKLILLGTSNLTQSVSENIELLNELYEVVNEVKLLEKNMDCPSSIEDRNHSDCIKKFTSWLNEHGAKFEGIEIAEFPGYELGLQTDVDIDESNLIMAIPRNLMFTIESAKDSSLCPLIETDPILNNMPNVTLAVFLLLEKFKASSFWKPYIDILPSKYNTILYFNIEELKELQASPILETALKQIRNIVRQYAYFYKLIWSLDDPPCRLLRKHFTFNEYRWAVSTIMTRQNTIPSGDGLEMINALIPLWDLCNHTNGTITTAYNPKLDCCECFAVKDFKAGEQVFIFYGARSNPELFIHNGFVYDDNEHDGYWLHLGISKSDALKESRIKVLNRLCLPENGEFCIKSGSRPINGQLLAFLRIFNMDEEQLHEWLEKDNIDCLKDLEFTFTTEFENKYWSFIVARLKLVLAIYKTTLEEDIDLIKKGNLSQNSLLACKMRASEKKLLQSAIVSAQQNIKRS